MPHAYRPDANVASAHGGAIYLPDDGGLETFAAHLLANAPDDLFLEGNDVTCDYLDLATFLVFGSTASCP